MTAKEILKSGREDVERVFDLALKSYMKATGADGMFTRGDAGLETSLMALCLESLSESFWYYNGKIFECRFSSLEELELKLAACV